MVRAPVWSYLMGEEVEETAKLKCFVVSTIGETGSKERDAADLVLDYLIKPALEDKYVVSRGDGDLNPGAITPQILESLLEADLVVADLSGYNPNVYYEVAIAHGYDRPTVHLQIAPEHPAFDLKDMRLVRYVMTNPRELASAVERLRDYAAFAATNPTKVRTPLSGAKQFLQIEESDDPIAQSNMEIIDQVRSLRTEVRRMVRPDPTPSRSADIRSMRMIIDRVRRRDALVDQDLSESITQQTSAEFDDWVRLLGSAVTGVNDVNQLNQMLFSADILAGADDPTED
jgi:hypothetical protein